MAFTKQEQALVDQLDPYGVLEFAVGSADDFICFDYRVRGDHERIALRAVVNSETGGFIQDFMGPLVTTPANAEAIARDMVNAALDWASENHVRLDMKGWEQDPAYFVRCVRRMVALLKDDGAKLPAGKRRSRNWRKDL